MNLHCWWFGCEPHPQDPAPIEYLECMRCGEVLDYESLAGITRWNGLKDWCKWFFVRSWLPAKCTECGKRYGDHPDYLPF